MMAQRSCGYSSSPPTRSSTETTGSYLPRSALSYGKRCSLLGCSLSRRCSPPSFFYCCADHQELSLTLSHQDLPYKSLGGFQSDERDKTCSSLILLKSENIQTGVPELSDSEIFLLHPWDQEMFTNPQKVSTNWIFFHDPVPSQIWKSAGATYSFEFCGYDILTTSLTLDKYPNWNLYWFRHKHLSLYCLAFTAVREPKLHKMILLSSLRNPVPEKEKTNPAEGSETKKKITVNPEKPAEGSRTKKKRDNEDRSGKKRDNEDRSI
ncbi:unnamed protein product [Thlaspi arvense]|uniref:Uncharacterized protein n=1 Tax=Thlaspi arvense TaxID=13288 RepID=A0AAU9R8D0_THLAR|nr:unnamed protein product [Thlaspi arvense]